MVEVLICAACGVHVREFRLHCGRCGRPLAFRSPTPPAARRRPIGTLGIVAGCLALGGFALMFASGLFSDAPASENAGAGSGRPVQPRAAMPVSAPVAATAGTALAPAPVAAALDSRRDGVAAYSRGDVSAALDEFTKAVQSHPDDPEARNHLGQMLVRSGRASEAIAHFDRAIGIADDRWAYHFNRARAYGEMKQWARAVAGYRDAARLFPEDYATQFNLARALQANGDLPGAIAAFQQAIQLAPGQADFRLSYGLALDSAQRPRDAAAAYRSVLELEPASPEAEKIKARIAQLEGAAPAPAATTPAATPRAANP